MNLIQKDKKMAKMCMKTIEKSLLKYEKSII